MARRNGPGSGPAFGTGTMDWRVRAPPRRRSPAASVAAAGGGLDPLSQRGCELWWPRSLARDDVGRGLDDLERRGTRGPRTRAGVHVGEPPVPGGAVSEDVDPQGQRPRLVEAVGGEPDRRGVQRRVVAAGVAGGP